MALFFQIGWRWGIKGAHKIGLDHSRSKLWMILSSPEEQVYFFMIVDSNIYVGNRQTTPVAYKWKKLNKIIK